MFEIIPSIIAKDFQEFENLVHKYEAATERVVLDISDGIFTPTLTISGFNELRKIETPLKFDAHLMVQRPSEQMYDWYKTKVDRFFFHAECDSDVQSLLEQVHYYNKKGGVVLNPETKIDDVIELIGSIDYIQFMTVHPGFYGREFEDDVLDKISSFHELYPGIPIAADGGITPETGKKAICAGASILIVGSYFLENPDPAKAIKDMIFEIDGLEKCKAI